jgi:hypothetical protein
VPVLEFRRRERRIKRPGNQARIGRLLTDVVVRGRASRDVGGRCFEHRAAAGRDFTRGTHDDVIEGNVLERNGPMVPAAIKDVRGSSQRFGTCLGWRETDL